MSNNQENSNPFVDPQVSLGVPTVQPEGDNTIKIVLSSDVPDMVENHNPGCSFFILGPFLWLINRRNTLAGSAEFEDSK
jgi:hypothetical protein